MPSEIPITARDVITATLRQAERSGESHEMKARYITEALTAAGYLIIKPTWAAAPNVAPSREL